jgi:HD-GYP domain-containing protein (c-di-GMP phosphodiesterase class II)
MQFVSAKEVCEGMYVAADVRDDMGRTLIARGQRIGQHHIVRLRKFRIDNIFIDPDNGEKVDKPEKSEIREQCEQVLANSISRTTQEFACKKLAVDPRAVKEATDRLVDALVQSQNPLVTLADMNTTGDRMLQHSVNTAVLATVLGKDLYLPEDMLRDLAVAMLFHDIGTIFLPDELTHKSSLPTPLEVEELRRHPMFGFEHLIRSKAISTVAASVILRHHEALNGSGYPQHVGAEKLSILMRIASVVEVYDSLTAPQFGLPATLPDAAVSYLMANMEKLFAKEVVAALCRRVALYPKGCGVQLTSGEIGLVAGTLPTAPTRPVVLVYVDSRGHRLKDPMIVDLPREPRRGVARSATTMEELIQAREAPPQARPIHPILATLG